MVMGSKVCTYSKTSNCILLLYASIKLLNNKNKTNNLSFPITKWIKSNLLTMVYKSLYELASIFLPYQIHCHSRWHFYSFSAKHTHHAISPLCLCSSFLSVLNDLLLPTVRLNSLMYTLKMHSFFPYDTPTVPFASSLWLHNSLYICVCVHVYTPTYTYTLARLHCSVILTI